MATNSGRGSCANISVTASTAYMVEDSSSTQSGDRRPLLPCFNNIKVFTCFLSVLACFNGAIAASYLPSVITTIEQRFQLDSAMSGLIVSSYEIGATTAVIFVSYMGYNRHIPAVIGGGALIIGIGSILFSIPHFISPVYSEEPILREEFLNSSDDAHLYCNAAPEDNSPNCQHGTLAKNNLYIAIFIIAQIIIGVGSCPILTVGLSYIDNYASKKASAQYIAIAYAAAILGSVIGFGSGAAMLEIFIDHFTLNPVARLLTSNDDLWLGAWWAGFILFAILMFLLAPWFFMFPKSMDSVDSSQSKSGKEADDTADVAEVNPTAGLSSNKLSEMPRSLLKLMKNPVYMLINMGSVFAMIIVTGFLTFSAKYLETQFYVKKSNASIYTGAAAVPAVVGIVVMGAFIKKYKIGKLGAIKSVLVLNLITMIAFGISFALGCNNKDIAGVTVPYPNGQMMSADGVNLTTDCNKFCQCNNNLHKPVCHKAQELTYFSFCHAGCLSSDKNQADQCTCVDSNLTSTFEPTIISGSCENTCTMLPAFLVMLAVISFSIAGIQTPIAMITLRCVSGELKSFALGIQVIIIRLIALLPAPIVYGAIFDSTCLWWNKECGKRLNCLVYSNATARYTFQGMSIGFHMMCTLMFFMCWLVMRRNPEKYADDDNTSEKCKQEVEVYVTHL